MNICEKNESTDVKRARTLLTGWEPNLSPQKVPLSNSEAKAR